MVILLISIINIVIITKLFINAGIGVGIIPNYCIAVICLQIISIIISIITLKKYINNDKSHFLIIILFLIFILTLALAVKTTYETHDYYNGLSPAVMPSKLFQNLYNITLYVD